MSTKLKILLLILGLLTSYAMGRWTAPEHIKIETRTVEIEKKRTDTDTNRDKNKTTTVVEIIRPDGTIERTTKTTENTSTERKTTSTDDKSTTNESSKEVWNGSKITISALGGVSLTPTQGNPLLYGVAASKPILGPLTIGLWYLNNNTTGASIGLSF